MHKRYKISLRGCDDTTEFEVNLNDRGKELLDKIAELSRKHSSYSCQPILVIEEVGGGHAELQA